MARCNSRGRFPYLSFRRFSLQRHNTCQALWAPYGDSARRSSAMVSEELFFSGHVRRLLQRANPDARTCWYDGVWFRAASRHETALHRARCRGLLDGWGAGRYATGGLGGVTRAFRPAFFSLSAGWLAGARTMALGAAPRAWGAHPSRDADLCCLCSRRVLRRRKASRIFKLWSSEPLVKISHSCQVPTNSGSAPARKACSA